MPEGHTIHRLARDHTQQLGGEAIEVSSPQGRHPALAALLTGQVLDRVEALGKHLFYFWTDSPIMHVHLGLIGHFETQTSPAGAARPSTQLRMAGPRNTVDLFGATTTELIDEDRLADIRQRLGPDLLADDADPNRAWERLRRRAVPIGQALLDQRVLSGVGNVFRAEALFVNGIHPERLANTLQRSEFDALWMTLASMLRRGVEERRIVTVHPSERNGSADDPFYVYKQEVCRRCGNPIRAWPLGPRRAYACERCQTPPVQP